MSERQRQTVINPDTGRNIIVGGPTYDRILSGKGSSKSSGSGSEGSQNPNTCGVCYRRRKSFVTCSQCKNKICLRCDKELPTRKCPFCRGRLDGESPPQSPQQSLMGQLIELQTGTRAEPGDEELWQNRILSEVQRIHREHERMQQRARSREERVQHRTQNRPYTGFTREEVTRALNTVFPSGMRGMRRRMS